MKLTAAKLVLLASSLLPAFSGCGKNVAELDLQDPLRTLAVLQAEHNQHAAKIFEEFDLGEFFIVKKQPESAYGLGISCHLFAEVTPEARGDFETRWAQRQQRTRDAIIVLVQQSDMDMLVGSDLELLKADLLKTCRRSLQTNHLHDVVISDFSVEMH